jgi:hypothetical protein
MDYFVHKSITDQDNFISQTFLADFLDDVAPLSGFGSNPYPDQTPIIQPIPNFGSRPYVKKAEYRDVDGNGSIKYGSNFQRLPVPHPVRPEKRLNWSLSFPKA